MTHSPWFDPPLPRVVAHRGLAVAVDGDSGAPENTLLAFRRALAAGATHLETDVRATRDGAAVLAHDPDLRRIAVRPVRIADLTLDELRSIPLGAGQTVCTLREALAAFGDARFNIDLKSEDAVVPAVAAIRDTGAADRVLVTSFSGRRRRAALRALPGAATSASSGAAAVALVAARLGVRPVVRLAMRRVDALQIPTRWGRFSTSTPRIIARIHGSGVEVHYWTVDDPDEVTRLLDAGADGIITDRTDLAVPLVVERRER